MLKRRRIKTTASFRDRLQAFAKDVRDRAAELPYGTEKDELLRTARRASHLEDWANSPGLQPPK